MDHPTFPPPDTEPAWFRNAEFLRTQVLPVATVLAVLFLFWRIWLLGGQRPEEREPVNCAIDAGPCVRIVADRRVTLDISPRPVTAMTDLTFTVGVEATEGMPISAGPVVIDLDMPAMSMGYNRVVCRSVEPGRYEGSGVIPICPSGLTTWAAMVRIPGLEEMEFTFDVAYR